MDSFCWRGPLVTMQAWFRHCSGRVKPWSCLTPLPPLPCPPPRPAKLLGRAQEQWRELANHIGEQERLLAAGSPIQAAHVEALKKFLGQHGSLWFLDKEGKLRRDRLWERWLGLTVTKRLRKRVKRELIMAQRLEVRHRFIITVIGSQPVQNHFERSSGLSPTGPGSGATLRLSWPSVTAEPRADDAVPAGDSSDGAAAHRWTVALGAQDLPPQHEGVLGEQRTQG
jgi:hypothetical protein